MPDHHNKKQFLKLPKYSGGTAAFREFISSSLHYPEAALEARVEGSVIVEYDVHDNGTVRHAHVLKGIGHGCDEEALRVVGLLRFETVKNRGVRVKMTTKTTINFKLPPGGVQITYTSAPKDEVKKNSEKDPNNPEPVVYNYTISL